MARFSGGVSREALKRAGLDPKGVPLAPKPDPDTPAPFPPGVLIVAGTIQGEGVSVNEAYVNVPGVGRKASAALKRFKASAAHDLKGCRLHFPPRPQPHALTVTHYGDWHTKEGQPRKRDLTNYLKALEDAVSAWLGLDDRWVYEVRARKVHAPDAPRIEFTLTTL